MALRYLTLPIIILLVWAFTAITSLLGIYRDWARGAVFVTLLIFALVDPKLFTRKGRVLSRIIKRKKRIFATEKSAADFAQKCLAKEYSTSSFVIIPDLSPNSEYGIHTSENGSKYYVGKVVRRGDRSGISEVFISEEGEWLDNVYINFFRSRIFADLNTLFREHKDNATSYFFGFKCAWESYAMWKPAKNYAKFLEQGNFSTSILVTMKEGLSVDEYYAAIKSMLESFYQAPVYAYRLFRIQLAVSISSQGARGWDSFFTCPKIFFADLQEYKCTFDASPMDLHSKICKGIILAEN